MPIKFKIFLAVVLASLSLWVDIISWPDRLPRSGSDTPVFRHKDEVMWAIRLQQMLKDSSLVAPWPAPPDGLAWYQNPHPMLVAWPFVRFAHEVGVRSPDNLVDFIRLASKIAFLGAACILIINLLRNSPVSVEDVFPCGILLGAYLATDPGLAHLKPLLSTLAGRGNNAFFIGFDRLVSPSLEIIVFTLALAALARLTLPAKCHRGFAVGCGLCFSLLLTLPPYYLICFALLAALLGLSSMAIHRAGGNSLSKDGRWVAAAIGCLPGLVYFVAKAASLANLPEVQEMFIRNWMLPSRALDLSILRRTWTLGVACLLMGAGFLLWRKRPSIWLALPMGWLAMALAAFNHQVLSGRELQNSHMERPLGLLLGVALVVVFSHAFRRKLWLAAAGLLILAMASHLLVCAKTSREFEKAKRDLHQDFLVSDSAFATARKIYLTAPLEDAVFEAPDRLQLALQYVTGWRSLSPWLSSIYPFSDHQIWEGLVRRGRLTGESVEEVFPTLNIGFQDGKDISFWPYGVPLWFEHPRQWFEANRRSGLAQVRHQALAAWEKECAYHGPFPLIVVAPTGNPLLHFRPSPSERTRVDNVELLIWTTPFVVEGRSPSP